MEFATHYVTYCHDVTEGTIPLQPFMSVGHIILAENAFRHTWIEFTQIYHLHEHLNSHNCTYSLIIRN